MTKRQRFNRSWTLRGMIMCISSYRDVAGRSDQEFPYIDVHPFIQQLLSVFGAERTVWGTGYPGHHRQKHNWPSLEQELRLIQERLPFLTDDDKDKILGGTAAQIWNLTT